MSYTHRELLDALSAMTSDEFEATVTEARSAHEDTRTFVRNIFGTEEREEQEIEVDNPPHHVRTEGGNPRAPRKNLAERQFIANLFGNPDADNLPDYS